MFTPRTFFRAVGMTLLLLSVLSGIALAATDMDEDVSYQGYLYGKHDIDATSSSCVIDGESYSLDCPYAEHWDEVKVILSIYKGVVGPCHCRRMSSFTAH